MVICFLPFVCFLMFTLPCCHRDPRSLWQIGSGVTNVSQKYRWWSVSWRTHSSSKTWCGVSITISLYCLSWVHHTQSHQKARHATSTLPLFSCSVLRLTLDFKRHLIYFFPESWGILATGIIVSEQATCWKGINILAQREARLSSPFFV